MTTAGFVADQLLCGINKNNSRISNRINKQYVCMHGHHILYSKGKDQPGRVASPARDQLNRENVFSPVPVRAKEFGLARRVRQSRPASACSSPYILIRLNLL